MSAFLTNYSKNLNRKGKEDSRGKGKFPPKIVSFSAKL